MRRIITYSTLGDNMKEVYSSARTLGELHPDLTRAGIRFDGMKLMTNPGQVTLESLQAELPEGEFQLFILPQKVKSGSWDDEEIDEEDGETWNETDWSLTYEDPEEHVFVSHRDLAIARAKKAFALLEKAFDYFTNTGSNAGTKDTSSDPVINSLREEAAKLQRIFG